MRKWALLLVFMTVSTLVSGCMGDESAPVSPDELSKLVLQPEDAGDALVRFDEGPLARADFQPGPRQEPDRFGRVDGWKARFRAMDPTEREGVLVVQSLVDVFEDSGGAAEDLAAYEQELRGNQPTRSGVSVEPIGEETTAVLFEANGVFFCTVAWRFENATASVSTQAFDRDTALAGAVDLSGKQQRRIAAAAG